MLLEDRVGKAQRVSIPIVDGDAYEPPAKISLREAAMHLIEANEIEPPAAEPS